MLIGLNIFKDVTRIVFGLLCSAVGVSKTNFEQVPVSVAKNSASEAKQRARRENKAGKKSSASPKGKLSRTLSK
jgi:hypothetical protein